MNPLTNMKNVKKLSEQELHTNNKTSWHDQYRDSAWIFVGGLPYDLTEGDIVCIFSQYGEIVNINLIRDKDSGKSKGFCFLCYEDQRSTVLAVDNFNGIKILNRTIRVDHVGDYKAPKEGKKTDAETKKLYQEGCAPKAQPVDIKPVIPPPQDIRETLADQIVDGVRLPPRLPIYAVKEEKLDVKEEKVELEKVKVEVADEQLKIKVKKEKKKKKDKKHKSKKKRKRESSESSERSNSPSDEKKRKKHRDEKRNKR